MSECLCESCRPALHPAAPGSPAYRYSKAWMRECLARELSERPRADRQAHYEAVAKLQGDEAARALVADVKRVHQAKQEALF